MHKVLVVMDILEGQKATLNNIDSSLDIKYIPADKVTPEDLKDVDAIIGNLNPELLSFTNNLKLMQLNNAGTEGFTKPGVIPEGAVLTNASGAYGVAMSEFMIGMLFTMMKHLDLYTINQTKNMWHPERLVNTAYGKTVLIVGFGNIGQEFGLRMKAFGCKVLAIRKHDGVKPDYIDGLYTMDSFYDCLKEADIVATALPGYEDTYKVFDKKAFDCMKDGAYFLNVGRGTAVDNDSIYDALVSGKLAGAALDVTDPEPLPEDSKLWSAPNIFITPHVSGGYRVKESQDRIVDIAASNLKHLINGEPYENIVDMKTGYRINE